MDEKQAAAHEEDSGLKAALAEYLERVDRGERPDREEFFARYPQYAGELRSFLAAEDELRRLAPAGPPSPPADTSTRSFARHGQETVAPQNRSPRAGPGTSGIQEEFGRYRIVRALGKGAMGTVYLAEDTQLLRQVALKVPHFDPEPTAELLERFYREARAAATLRHPHICPVYDVGQIEGTHYISMAYIDGHPLSAFIRATKQQPERQVLIVVRKLAQALQEAHEHGIVHRDLKPANIMVDQRNEPIIMDFGLARHRGSEQNIRITQTGTLLGTPAYMSPEQVNGELEDVGPATDQYSLGVILYELLTGQLPFRGSITAVLAQILTKEVTPPRQLRPGLDDRIEAVCLKMMAKSPADRFASLAAAAEELATILRNPNARPTATGSAGGSQLVERPALEQPTPIPTDSATKPPASAAAKSLVSMAEQAASAPLLAKDLASLEELARKCLGRRDYEQVIQIVERIPAEERSEGLALLLQKARDKTDEIAFLVCEIEDAVRFNDWPTALTKADALLKVKPGHHRALRVQKEFEERGKTTRRRLKPLEPFTRPWKEGGWIPWSALAFGLAVFGVMSGVIFIWLNKAVLVIDARDPGIEISVKGKTALITVPGKQSIKVTPGDQMLTVSYAGLETQTKTFSMKRGETKTLIVSIEDSKLFAALENEIAPRAGDTGEKARLAASGAPSPPGAAGKQPASAPTSEKGRTTPAAATPPPALLVAPFDEPAARTAREKWAKYLARPAEISDSLGMKLVLIPPGEFLMGASEKEEFTKAQERPQHSVRISRPFYLGSFEVTRGQFAKFVAATGYKTDAERDGGKADVFDPHGEPKPGRDASWEKPGFDQNDSHPVVIVSWNDADAFCQWLSRKEGRTYRLPTEAEWEYACRGGTTTRYSAGNRLADLFTVGNGLDESFRQHFGFKDADKRPTDGFVFTAPVGSFPANHFALCDMHGNVWEWCQDWFAPGYNRSPQTDPSGPAQGTLRVARGGAFDCGVFGAASASRDALEPLHRAANVGFRVVCVAAEGPAAVASNATTPGTKIGNQESKESSAKTAPPVVPDLRKKGYLVAPFNRSEARKAQQEWGGRTKTPAERTKSIGMALRLIPPGQFQMGSNDDRTAEFVRPLHKVTVTRPFYFGIYEVTRGQFAKFAAAASFKTKADVGPGGWRLDNSDKHGKWMAKHRFTWRRPGFPQDDSHPVVDVCWDDVQAFCAWLSKKEGARYRLPTEAEWEYACRSGTTGWNYGDVPRDKLVELGNVADATALSRFPAWQWCLKTSDGFAYTSPVGRFKPNNFGLYDTLGNVQEWCSDWFGPNYYKQTPENDPPGPPDGKRRCARGGAYDNIADCNGRWAYRVDHHSYDVGFRVVCDIRYSEPADNPASTPQAARPLGPAPSPDNSRRVWISDHSRFENLRPGAWRETLYRNGKVFNFQEVGRTAEYVELIDLSRGKGGVHVRLLKDQMLLLIGGRDTQWQSFKKGEWAAANKTAERPSGPTADQRQSRSAF